MKRNIDLDVKSNSDESIGFTGSPLSTWYRQIEEMASCDKNVTMKALTQNFSVEKQPISHQSSTKIDNYMEKVTSPDRLNWGARIKRQKILGKNPELSLQKKNVSLIQLFKELPVAQNFYQYKQMLTNDFKQSN